MKRIAILLIVACGIAVGPAFAQGTGTLNGVAQNAQQQILSGVQVQLRNVDTGQLAGTTTSAANGGFAFTGLNPANYVIEIVDATGKIIGVSSSIAVGSGAVISGVIVAASAAGAVAGAAAAGGLAAFFTSTGGLLVLAGAAVGVAAGIAAATGGTASPSR